MSVSRHRVLCVFCNKRGPRAREEVVPDWLAKEVGGQAPWTAFQQWARSTGDITWEGRKRGGDATMYKIPNVCKKCNNVWMSELEQEMIPLAPPLIHHRKTRLSRAHQDVIARWLTLRMLVNDEHFQDLWIPRDKGTHAFYASRVPMPRTQVLIGSVVPHPVALIAGGRREVVVEDDGVTHKHAVLMSVVFKHWFAQVAYTYGEAAPLDFVRPTDSDKFVQCWPIVSDYIDWPLPRSFSPDELAALVEDPTWGAEGL